MLILGTLFIITGIIITASSTQKITGFTIMQNFISNHNYLIGLLFFAGGITFLLSGNLLQKRLGEMEKDNPSQSYKEKPVSLPDKVKSGFRSIGRVGRVEQVLQDENKYASGSDYQEGNYIDEQQTEDESRMKRNKKSNDDLYWMRDKKLVGIARDSKELENIPDKYSLFNLERAYDKKKDDWKRNGVEWDKDGKIKKKLESIRRGYLTKTQDSNFEEIKKDARLGKTGNLRDKFVDITYTTQELEKLGGEKGKYWKMMKETEDEFERHAPRVGINEFLQRHPNELIVSTLPYIQVRDASNHGFSSLHNNYAMGGANINDRIKRGDLNSENIWERFLDKIVRDKPTIAASSIEMEGENPARYLAFSRIGAIIGNGEIYSAGPTDQTTIALSNKLRTGGYHEKGTKDEVLESIDHAVKGRDGHYNEFSVGKPQVTGLFADPGYVSQRTFDDIRAKARNLGVPFYKFDEKTGLKELKDEPVERKRAA